MRAVMISIAVVSVAALGATREIHPTDSFEQAVGALTPGDTLIVHAGTYSETSRVSITVKGTPALPVLIKGADGEAKPLITRAAAVSAQNTINVEGATWLTIRDLEISSNGGDGVNLSSTPSQIMLEDLDIHDIDVGVNFRSNMDHITVRHCHIHQTGAGGAGTGEGMYVGCNNGTCVVHDSVLEGNWIHDTRGSTQGDGIEIKQGSWGNVARDNVIHDTQYPCFTMYGTLGNPVNIIERNVTWACDDAAIQVGADVIVRNNLFIEATGQGFVGNPLQGDVPGNVTVVHNTIVSGTTCVRMNNWGGKTGLVFSNNAVYCPTGSYVAPQGVAGVVMVGNVFSPITAIFPATFTAGNSVAMDFVSAATRDFAPSVGSPMIGAASAAWTVTEDFYGNSRAGTSIAGAIVASGWKPVAGFKPLPMAPPMDGGTDAGAIADGGLDAGADGGGGGGGGSLDGGSGPATKQPACGCASGINALGPLLLLLAAVRLARLGVARRPG